MDPELAKQYRARWQAVAEIEAEERRRATLTDRWHQLTAIVQMALDLGLDLSAQSDDDHIVWERWARLKEGLP